MNLVAGETFVVLKDRPIVERVFNAFSAVAGGLTAWFCVRVYAPGGGWGDLALALFVPFLLAFAIAGLWRALTLPTTVCRVDGAGRVVELTQRAPLLRRQGLWRFDDIAELHADARSGYEASWRVVASLRDGRRVVLMPHAGDDRETVDRFVLEARRVMTPDGS
jgi:hypothetical protein